MAQGRDLALAQKALAQCAAQQHGGVTGHFSIAAKQPETRRQDQGANQEVEQGLQHKTGARQFFPHDEWAAQGQDNADGHCWRQEIEQMIELVQWSHLTGVNSRPVGCGAAIL